MRRQPSLSLFDLGVDVGDQPADLLERLALFGVYATLGLTNLLQGRGGICKARNACLGFHLGNGAAHALLAFTP
jgi:hypothetical protein